MGSGEARAGEECLYGELARIGEACLVAEYALGLETGRSGLVFLPSNRVRL